MQKQAVNKEFENNSMDDALEALGKSIVRWTDKGDRRSHGATAHRFSTVDRLA